MFSFLYCTHQNKTTKETGDSKCTPTSKTPPLHGRWQITKEDRRNLTRRKRKEKTTVYYFYDGRDENGRRKEIPLGTDYVAAVREWAKHEAAKLPENAVITFNILADKFENEHAPAKTAGTQKAIKLSLKRLRQFFDGAPLDEIQPQHIARYLEWRKSSPVAANNDI